MKIFVVYHSQYGHTEKVAKSVADGAKKGGADVTLLTAKEAIDQLDSLDGADAIIFGSPTYMGSVSAGLKEFLEAASKKWQSQAWKDKIAAGFTNSGSQSGDKLNTLGDIYLFAMQQSMIWTSMGILPGNNSSGGSVDDLNRIGAYSGLMTQSNVDEGPDKAPLDSDLKTAEFLGERVAQVTKRWINGK
ncbi:flavodoxin family protein [Limibacter armeniacum]|uniref:flavodoxin family protein n=1 Tax=Limibacter armeniacum TaxID=466084 RepID=UPI002FE5A26F